MHDNLYVCKEVIDVKLNYIRILENTVGKTVNLILDKIIRV